MGALKPREPFGELEVRREGRRIVVRVPSDDVSERIVFTVDETEARSLAQALGEAWNAVPGRPSRTETLLEEIAAQAKKGMSA